MKVLVTICARSGSKGIPGKNIRNLNGLPLIAYSINCAVNLQKFHNVDIALSSDARDIMDVAAAHGLVTSYVRPEFLATDTAGKLDVIQDLLTYEETERQCRYDYIIDLDVSSPLRSIDDLLAAFDMLKNDEKANNLFSVNRANRNPYFNMVERQANGYFGLVKKAEFLTRQSAPEVYDLNASFYIYKRSFFDRKTPVINEFSMVYVMPHICFDLDHEIDFVLMEYVLSTHQLNFSLC